MARAYRRAAAHWRRSHRAPGSNRGRTPTAACRRRSGHRGDRCVERRSFTWAVQASHSGPRARTIWYVRPLPSRLLGEPHPSPRVQPLRGARPGTHRRRRRMLARPIRRADARNGTRGMLLSNRGACRTTRALVGVRGRSGSCSKSSAATRPYQSQLRSRVIEACDKPHSATAQVPS
jgi:hypothetical protein